jgi:hypothetical protein
MASKKSPSKPITSLFFVGSMLGLWGPWQALGPVGVTWCEKPPPLEEEMAEKFGGGHSGSAVEA